MAARNALGPGTQIGGYVIEEVLGTGGMGLVYRAYHHRLQRSAAIKVLLYFSGTAENLERFEREAQTVAKLRHPNILTIFDFGEYEGQPYMVTEYMPNGSLESMVGQGPLPPKEVVALLRPLAAALDYAHIQGVVHRDVKPGNVFLDSDGKPVLADFGLSKLFTQNSLTTSFMVQGTPSYIAPEQARGKAPTGATDLYSLTIMAYELLTGRLPFEGEEIMDTLYAQVNDPPPSATTTNPDLPRGVDLVLMKGLAKDPEQRWHTSTQMVDMLERAVDGRFRPPVITWRRATAVLAVVLLGGVLALAALQLGLASVVGHVPAATASPGQPGPTQSTAAARSVAVDETMPLQIGGALTVHGQGLDPTRSANVGMLQGQGVHPITEGGLKVDPDGTFSITGFVPSDLQPGQAMLLACNVLANGTSDLHSCAQLQVSLKR